MSHSLIARSRRALSPSTRPTRSTTVLALSMLALSAASLSGCGQAEQSDEAPAASSKLASLQLSAEATQAMIDYERDGQAFVTALDNGADAQALTPRAQALLDKAVLTAPEYIGIFPNCAAHLNAALEIETKWKTLSPEEIETGYHAGEALPPEPKGSNCYHMKDVIVHPATALALLAQEPVNRDQVRAEIAEVIAHAVAVRTGVGANVLDSD